MCTCGEHILCHHPGRQPPQQDTFPLQSSRSGTDRQQSELNMSLGLRYTNLSSHHAHPCITLLQLLQPCSVITCSTALRCVIPALHGLLEQQGTVQPLQAVSNQWLAVLTKGSTHQPRLKAFDSFEEVSRITKLSASLTVWMYRHAVTFVLHAAPARL